MGKHKSGYVQQSVKIRSRSENDTDIVQMMLSDTESPIKLTFSECVLLSLEQGYV